MYKYIADIHAELKVYVKTRETKTIRDTYSKHR